MRNCIQIFQVETIMTNLTKSSPTKNYLSQIESVLFELADLPCTQASKKLQPLSMLIKGAEENMMSCDQVKSTIKIKY